MKIVIFYSLFFVLSTFLFVDKKEIKVEKFKKNYKKRRKEFVPTRVLALAQEEIDATLDTKFYLFSNNSINLEENISGRVNINSTKVTLIKLVKILNHLEEDAILIIKTYSDQNGSKAYNLELSQKRADVLKKYFIERTYLPLIIAIGYGKTLVSKKDNKTKKYRQVEINLKRIK